MEESMILYFISKLDWIRMIFVISTIFSSFTLLACFLICIHTDEYPPKFVLWLMVIIFLGSVVMDIFVPDTEEGLALYRETYQIPSKGK